VSEDEFAAQSARDEEEDNDGCRENESERDNRGAVIVPKSMREVAKCDQYRSRVPQEMDLACYQ
jgi:hypothetical protein